MDFLDDAAVVAARSGPASSRGSSARSSMMFLVAAAGPAGRHRGGDLPRGVRARQPGQPHPQHDRAQPGGRPGGRLRHPRAWPSSSSCSAASPAAGRVISGGLTLAVARPAHHDHRHRGGAARGARRASARPASASGATRWEVIRSHVLPYAAPGILTGVILTLARAFGETAPLLLVGAAADRLRAARDGHRSWTG